MSTKEDLDNGVVIATKRPVSVRAVQWTGENFQQIRQFCPAAEFSVENELYINTLEGVMKAIMFSYIIEGVDGEFYPCKLEIFHKTYTI